MVDKCRIFVGRCFKYVDDLRWCWVSVNFRIKRFLFSYRVTHWFLYTTDNIRTSFWNSLKSFFAITWLTYRITLKSLTALKLYTEWFVNIYFQLNAIFVYIAKIFSIAKHFLCPYRTALELYLGKLFVFSFGATQSYFIFIINLFFPSINVV